jgi:prophage regulatory protein
MQNLNYKSSLQLIKLKQASELTKLSKSTIYTFIQAGTFPRPVKIGRRAVAWRLSDISKWLSDKCGSVSK